MTLSTSTKTAKKRDEPDLSLANQQSKHSVYGFLMILWVKKNENQLFSQKWRLGSFSDVKSPQESILIGFRLIKAKINRFLSHFWDIL